MALEANKAIHEGWDDTSKRLIAEYQAREAREGQIEKEIEEIELNSSLFEQKQVDKMYALQKELRACNPALGAQVEQLERQMSADKVANQEHIRQLRAEYYLSVQAREALLPQIREAEAQWKQSHQAMNEDMNRLAEQAMAAEAAARATKRARQTRASSVPSLHLLPR